MACFRNFENNTDEAQKQAAWHKTGWEKVQNQFFFLVAHDVTNQYVVTDHFRHSTFLLSPSVHNRGRNFPLLGVPISNEQNMITFLFPYIPVTLLHFSCTLFIPVTRTTKWILQLPCCKTVELSSLPYPQSSPLLP